MSTIDHLLITDLVEVPAALRAPIGGVSLATYLLVEAARLDALPLPAVLTWLGLSEAVFARAEARWSERIDEALGREEGTFDALYQDLLVKALTLWTRPIDPLDRDVEAWVSFQRHALAADDPGALARRAGLTAGDELRLTHLWQGRLASPETAARAGSALSGSLSPLPEITLSPFVFPPPPPVECP